MVNRTQRKRGVIADRKKLEQALFAAGFKTQAALAEHIASLENLDSAPKDMVNRVFRQIAVSPVSIERIAAALNVDAYTLYLTSDSEALEPETDDGDNKIKQNLAFKYVGLTGLALLTLFTFAWVIYPKAAVAPVDLSPKSFSNPLKNHYDQVISHGTTPSIALYGTHDQKKSLQIVRETLQNDFNIVPNTVTHSPDAIVSTHEIERKQVDFIVVLNTRTYGRYVLQEAFLANNKQRLMVAQNFYATEELDTDPETIATKLSTTIRQFFLSDKSKDSNQRFINSTAAKFYVEGLDLLEKSYNLEYIKTAQSRFLNTIKIAPKFAQAHAGLCQAYVYESWSSDERYLLEQALTHCKKAKQLAPNHPFVIASNGLMLRRTGKTDKAIELLSTFSPKNAAIFYQLSYAQLESFHKNSPKNPSLDKAKQSINNAIAKDPNNWKYHFFLGVIEWSDGNRQQAINATEKADVLNSNEIVLTNLGTLHYCMGHVEKAKRYYHTIIETNPNSYLPVEQLSMLYYFSGENKEAIKLREKSILLAGDAGIHQMWGALADMYSTAVQPKRAVNAYQQAIAILDRDYARGNQSESDQVYRFYYTTRIELLTEITQIDHSIKLERIEQLSKNNRLDLPAMVRLGLLYQYFSDNSSEHNTFLNQAIDKCPIYKQLPEITIYSSSMMSAKSSP
ncbi:tetratricopeptide repeat protein [Thalassotalea sediminis]|uniref:tetratricopeptide repeat protein n=1 Tax=Thalassotalea sediminis TaxID=1759089 RepID=UPI002572EFA9|nr:hypothetical protein [Thalassotalea sediminis]